MSATALAPCWCERTYDQVPLTDLRRGITYSCGPSCRPGCRIVDDAMTGLCRQCGAKIEDHGPKRRRVFCSPVCGAAFRSRTK